MSQGAKGYLYFDDYRSQTFNCPQCGWAGGFDELDREMYRDVFDGSCPKCQKMLMVVSYAMGDQIREAAAAGNEEAIGMLPMVAKREEMDRRFKEMQLQSPEQLPVLDGDELEFVWDQEADPDGTEMMVIRFGDQVLWREPVFFECWPRFNEVKEIIKEKYGDRFKSLTPTERSQLNLLGDDLGAYKKISCT